MATKMKMVMKGGKMVPAFAADGKGKMKMGGAKMKKFEPGGVNDFEERQRRKRARAETRAEIASIEGEGTVADKRNNRAQRISVATGTARVKVPKSVSTSTSTTTSNTDNRNSGNTSNTTSSGSSSGSTSGANAGANADSGSSSNSNSRSSSTTPIRTPQQGKTGKPDMRPKVTLPPKSKRGGPVMKKAMYGASMDPSMMNPSMMNPGMMKKGGKVATKKYFTGGPTGDDMSTMKATKPVKKPNSTTGSNKGMIAPKKMGGSTIKKAMYGTAMKSSMMRKGGTKKK